MRKAFSLVRKTEAKRHLARALLVRGKILKRTSLPRAEAALQEALALTKEMGTVILEKKVVRELEDLY